MIAVLADHGARRDLSQSLAEGIARSSPSSPAAADVEFMIQLDEPLLPAVLAGTIATASGFSRHRSVEPSEVSGAMIQTRERVAPTPVAVHCCAADPPIELLRLAGVSGVLLDIDQLSSADWDAVEQPSKRDSGSGWVHCPPTVRSGLINSGLINSDLIK